MLNIIIPTIGRSSLMDAVMSLSAQTHPDWRAFVVGDGMMPNMEWDDGRISIHRAPNFKNASLVRNYALRFIPSAFGQSDDWVGFLDDDDILCDQYVEKFWENHDGYDMLVYRMDLHGNHLPTQQQIDSGEFVYGNIGISFAIRQDIFKVRHFIPHGPLGNEDFNLAHEMKASGHKIKFLDYVGYKVGS